MLFLLASGAVAVSISRFASAKVVIFGDTFRSRCLYLVDFGSELRCVAQKNIVVRTKRREGKKQGGGKAVSEKKFVSL